MMTMGSSIMGSSPGDYIIQMCILLASVVFLFIDQGISVHVISTLIEASVDGPLKCKGEL